MKTTSNNPNVYLWAKSALATIPCKVPTVLLMRHGEKEPQSMLSHVDNQLGKYDNTRMLTARGKTDAKIMGRLLMPTIARVEHSVVPRCRQTAKHMACGAKFNGTVSENSMLNGAKFIQCGAMRNGKKSAGSFSKLINRLAVDGCYPGFNPVHPFMNNMAHHLLSNAKPGINVSVSHDWILYLMLVAVGIKVAPFVEECICYLEPLFIWRQDNKIFFYYRNKKIEYDDAFCKLTEKEQ